jgi:hypothetical protein
VAMACRACSTPIAHRGGLLQKSYPLDTVNDFKGPDQLVADGFDGQGDLTVPNDKAPEGALWVSSITQIPQAPAPSGADHLFLLTTRTISRHCLA